MMHMRTGNEEGCSFCICSGTQLWSVSWNWSPHRAVSWLRQQHAVTLILALSALLCFGRAGGSRMETMRQRQRRLLCRPQAQQRAGKAPQRAGEGSRALSSDFQSCAIDQSLFSIRPVCWPGTFVGSLCL